MASMFVVVLNDELIHIPVRGLPFSSPERVVLGQSKVDFALGHRSRRHMRSLNSPLTSIVNAFLNGQLGLTA